MISEEPSVYPFLVGDIRFDFVASTEPLAVSLEASVEVAMTAIPGVRKFPNPQSQNHMSAHRQLFSECVLKRTLWKMSISYSFTLPEVRLFQLKFSRLLISSSAKQNYGLLSETNVGFPDRTASPTSHLDASMQHAIIPRYSDLSYCMPLNFDGILVDYF